MYGRKHEAFLVRGITGDEGLRPALKCIFQFVLAAITIDPPLYFCNKRLNKGKLTRQTIFKRKLEKESFVSENSPTQQMGLNNNYCDRKNTQTVIIRLPLE